MSNPNNLPQSISHKKLNNLLLHAPKDIISSDNLNDTDSQEKQEFDELMNQWETATRDVIKKISKRNENFFKDKSSDSLIALGAFEAHLNMALQALNAFNKDK